MSHYSPIRTRPIIQTSREFLFTKMKSIAAHIMQSFVWMTEEEAISLAVNNLVLSSANEDSSWVPFLTD